VRNRTHEPLGISVAIAVGLALDAGMPETTGLASAALFGSRTPDVDQLGTHIHRPTALKRHRLRFRATGTILRVPLVGLRSP
jgi:hypothetical protein